MYFCMNSQHVDGLLKAWARTAEPDAAAIARLQSSIARQLESVRLDPGEADVRNIARPRWVWGLVHAACAAGLLAWGICCFLKGEVRPSACPCTCNLENREKRDGVDFKGRCPQTSCREWMHGVETCANENQGEIG